MTDLKALADAWDNGYDACFNAALAALSMASAQGYAATIRNPRPVLRTPTGSEAR